MCEGYGFSVWYVPINYKELQYLYKIDHIPHITYQTNFETFNDAEQVYQLIDPTIKVNFCSKIIQFPQMYPTDPLLGCGFYVEKSQYLNPTFDPHLTTKYFVPKREFNQLTNQMEITNLNEIDEYLQWVNSFDIPSNVSCFKAISDNRNLDANIWEIKKKEIGLTN